MIRERLSLTDDSLSRSHTRMVHMRNAWYNFLVIVPLSMCMEEVWCKRTIIECVLAHLANALLSEHERSDETHRCNAHTLRQSIALHYWYV